MANRLFQYSAILQEILTKMVMWIWYYPSKLHLADYLTY